MEKLLFQAPQAEVDQVFLLNLFKDYKSPKDKISYLIKTENLISIKRGIYVLADIYGKKVSKKILAGMIYSPSYISMQSALQFYSLAPEATYSEISVTTKRTKKFSTSLGLFEYHNASLKDFTWGLRFAKVDEGRHFRIASPIKALYDLLAYSIPNLNEFGFDKLLEYVELLRLDEDIFTISKEEYLGLEKAYYKSLKYFLLNWLELKKIEVKNERQY